VAERRLAVWVAPVLGQLAEGYARALASPAAEQALQPAAA
jgi:hypothetical protein